MKGKPIIIEFNEDMPFAAGYTSPNHGTMIECKRLFLSKDQAIKLKTYLDKIEDKKVCAHGALICDPCDFCAS